MTNVLTFPWTQTMEIPFHRDIITLTPTLANRIAESVLERYKHIISARRKHIQFVEKTVLAAFVHVYKRLETDPVAKTRLSNGTQDEVVCATITIATGTRCVGHVKPEEAALILRDCHAEVLARRVLVHYVLQQKKKHRSVPEHGWFLYISQAPCGDACVPPIDTVPPFLSRGSDKLMISTNNKENGQQTWVHKSFKRFPSSDMQCKTDRSPGGAHAIQDQIIHPHGSSSDYMPGLVRTKPGRGHPSSSMSCSDKICKWCVVGLQGALPTLIGLHIYVNGIVIHGNHGLGSAEISRAFHTRLLSSQKLPQEVTPCEKEAEDFNAFDPLFPEGLGSSLRSIAVVRDIPCYLHCALCAEITEQLCMEKKDTQRLRLNGEAAKEIPSLMKFSGRDELRKRRLNGYSLLWSPTLLEVINSKQGRKQGVTFRDRYTQTWRSAVCTEALAKQTLHLLMLSNDNQHCEFADIWEKQKKGCLTLTSLKNEAKNYASRLRSFKKKFPFREWIREKKKKEFFFTEC